MPVRPAFLAALEHVESGGDPNAVSPKGAIGVMQVMPATARAMGYDPEAMRGDVAMQREAGARYAEQLSQRYNGNEYLMAAAYNAGPERVDKWLAGQGSLPAETRAYVPKVMAFLNGNGGGIMSTDAAQAAYHVSRQRRSDESLGSILMSLFSPAEASAAEGPPDSGQAQPTTDQQQQPEVQTGSLQPSTPGGIPPMTFSIGRQPASPFGGGPTSGLQGPAAITSGEEPTLQIGGRRYNYAQLNNVLTGMVGGGDTEIPEEAKGIISKVSEFLTGGKGEAAAQAPVELPAAAAIPEGASPTGAGTPPSGGPPPPQRPIVPPGAGEVPHRILTMSEAAKATPMTPEDFNAIDTIGEGEHTLIKQPIDPLDLLRMHYYGIDKGLEAFNAAEVARQTGNAADMVHSALLNNELQNTVVPRWAAAWHQFGLGLRLGRELKPESDFMRDLSQVMQENNDIGGLLAGMAKLKTPEDRAEMARQAIAGGRQNLASSLLGYYVESMLSLNTVAKKALTDATLATWQVPERFVAAQISRVARLLGAAPENTVAPGEAQALAKGLIEGADRAAKLAAQALQEDKSPLDPDIWGPVGWGEASRSPEEMQQLAELGEGEGSTFGAGLNLLSEFVHLPSRGILTTDTFAKAINQHANLNALMYRRAYWATAARDLPPEDFAEALQDAFDNLQAKPPTDLVQQSIQVARKNTLSQALDLHPERGIGYNDYTLGRLAQGVQGLRQSAPLSRAILPFWPTLVNLARTGVEFSGPLGVLSRSMRDEILSNTPERYTALARMGMSSLLIMGLWKHVQGAGPSNPVIAAQWREEGNQEYSIGTAHHDIGNLPEPLAETVRLTADARDLVGRVNQRDAETLGAATAMMVAKQLDDATSVKNLMNVIRLADSGAEEFKKAMSEGQMLAQMTPEQQQLQESIDAMQRGTPSQKAGRALTQLAGTVVPASVASLAHAMDPVHRQVRGIIDEFASRTPGWSKTLSPEVNLYGKPAIQPMGWNRLIGNQISLFRTTEIKNDPITKQLVDLNVTVPLLGHDGMLTVGSSGARQQMPVTPEQVTRVNELRGSMKEPYTGLDLHQALTEQMNSEDFKKIPSPQDKRTSVMRTINSYSAMAVAKLMDEDKDLQSRYRTAVEARQQIRSGGASLGLGAP